ncbi:MAG: M20/M25/M40 family metallo-hydrolase [Clostridia bacterium]
MSEFLAPLNYDRARDVLRRLAPFTSYTPEGAQAALGVLRQCYPLVFSKLEVKTFAKSAILLEMGGANVTDPLVFASHLDAPRNAALCMNVPIHELPMSVPLSRAHVVALLEALEELLRDGYRPGGDLFLALSMDGLSGGEGAKSIAAHLKARSVEPCFVLDYGGYATMEAFRTYLPPNAPLALIGITEKGLLEGTVVANEQVHSDQGRAQAHPLNELLKCGARLSRRPRRAALCYASEQMLRALKPHAPFLQRLLVSNPRLSFPLLRCLWRGRSVLNQFFLSELLPYACSAHGTPHAPADVATLRFCQTVIPGKKTAEYRRHIRKLVRNKALTLDFAVDSDSSPRSEPQGEAWDALGTAIEIQFERAVIVPCLSPFVTDGRFYAPLGGKIYRFSPFLLTGSDALCGECTITDGTLQTAVQFFRSMLSV